MAGRDSSGERRPGEETAERDDPDDPHRTSPAAQLGLLRHEVYLVVRRSPLNNYE